jgi:hypothetical protein
VLYVDDDIVLPSPPRIELKLLPVKIVLALPPVITALELSMILFLMVSALLPPPPIKLKLETP